MVALGIFGQKCYLGDTWNRLDFFIVMAGSVTKPHKFVCCGESKKTPESQICRLAWLVFIMSCESRQAQAKAKSPEAHLVSPLASMPDYGVGYECQGKNRGVFSSHLFTSVTYVKTSAPGLVPTVASVSQCSWLTLLSPEWVEKSTRQLSPLLLCDTIRGAEIGQTRRI